MIRLVLLEEHALVRREVRDALHLHRDLLVVGEAGSHDELVSLAQRTFFEVLVMEIRLPGRCGLAVLEGLRSEMPSVRPLVLSMYPEDPYAVTALNAGARGYVHKASAPTELPGAIRTVAQGLKYMSPAVAALLQERPVAGGGSRPHERLSELELQTLRLIASGNRLADIAIALELSPKTVSVHRARLMEKMKLSSNFEITHYAASQGLAA